MQFDNPAGRLYEILNSVRSHGKNTQARDVWNQIFGLPKDDLSHELAAKLAKTALLVHESVLLLEDEHPDLASPPPSWVAQVITGFMTHNVHGTIESFQVHVSNETLVNVKTAAILLHKGSGRKLLSQQETAEIAASLTNLLEEVLNSDQPAELKSYLVRSIRKMLTAIDEYRLTGATAFLEIVEQTVGHAMVDPAYKSFLCDTELGKRVLDTLGAASNLVTVAVGLPALAQAVHLFFLS